MIVADNNLTKQCESQTLFNSTPPAQNGCHFADDIFSCILGMKSFVCWFEFQICSRGSKWQYISIGSGNGLVPNKQQAVTWTYVDPVNTLRLKQNGRHFADNIFKCIFLN